jgi:hypothetical protein
MPHMTSIFHILLWSLFCITHCSQAPLTVPRSLCNTTASISCPQVTIWCDVSMFSVTGPYFFVKNMGSYHSRGFWAMLHYVARIFYQLNCEGWCREWEMCGFNIMVQWSTQQGKALFLLWQCWLGAEFDLETFLCHLQTGQSQNFSCGYISRSLVLRSALKVVSLSSQRAATSKEQVLEKLTVSRAQEISVIYRTWRFITMWTTACHWTLSWDNFIQCTSSFSNTHFNINPLFTPGPFRQCCLSDHLNPIKSVSHATDSMHLSKWK